MCRELELLRIKNEGAVAAENDAPRKSPYLEYTDTVCWFRGYDSVAIREGDENE